MNTFKCVTSRCSQHVHRPRVSLTAFGGIKLKIPGQVSLVGNHRREKREVTFEIVGNYQTMPNMIGRQSSIMLGLVKRVHMMQCSNILNADLFTGVGCLRGEYDIKLDTSDTPTKISTDNNNNNGRNGSFLRGWQPQMRETHMICNL